MATTNSETRRDLETEGPTRLEMALAWGAVILLVLVIAFVIGAAVAT